MKMQETFLKKLEKFAEKAKEFIPTIQVLAVGGGEKDLDCIIVAEKLHKTYDLKNWAEEFFRKKVSISPFTLLMWEKHIWSSKVATMIYKGCHYLIGENYKQEISWEELKTIVGKESHEFLNRILKALTEGMGKDKAIELLIQQLAILLSKEEDCNGQNSNVHQAGKQKINGGDSL